MKSFKNQTKVSIKYRPKPEEKRSKWVSKPTPLEPQNHYEEITRIFPSYVAQNFKFFELLTAPNQNIKNWEGYILRLKKKIACMKAEFLL